ncbi:hypothetical protein AB4K20DRAFT_1921457 [Rhizopus microsporus]
MTKLSTVTFFFLFSLLQHEAKEKKKDPPPPKAKHNKGKAIDREFPSLFAFVQTNLFN